MFSFKRKKHENLKKAVYLSASMIFGLLLALLAHIFIEFNYLFWATSNCKFLPFYDGCVLPPLLQISLWLLGAVGGFFLGRLWWQKVYVEKVWAKKR